MKRRLFTILSALSVLLFVAVVVLWMRSHQVTDYLMRRPMPDSGSDWFVSHWLLALMALALPVFWFVRARRKRADHRASDQKLCSSCRYDLRATPKRCPECGRVSAKAGS